LCDFTNNILPNISAIYCLELCLSLSDHKIIIIYKTDSYDSYSMFCWPLAHGLLFKIAKQKKTDSIIK